MEARFEGGVAKITCLPWESKAGLLWAELLADLRRRDRAMPLKDSLIAACALLHNLAVVTRNTGDFEKAGMRIFDPLR